MKKASRFFIALLGFVLLAAAVASVIYTAAKIIIKEHDFHMRFRRYFDLTRRILLLNQNNKTIDKFFKDNNIHTVALYGMGSIFELIYPEIKKTDVKVLYIIDKLAEGSVWEEGGIPVVGLDGIETRESVDAIIITPIYDFKNIFEDLLEKGFYSNVISAEDVV